MSADKKLSMELSDSLSATLLTYIKSVVSEQLKMDDGEYTIGYGPDWRDDSELHPSIVEKCGIRIYFIDKQRSDRPISILFVLTDKLGEIFKQYDVAPFLNVTLDADNGDDFFTFTSRDDLTVLKHCSPLFQNQRDLEKFSQFVDAVPKELLLTTIKYS